MYENDQGHRLTFYMTSASGRADRPVTLQSLPGDRRNTVFWTQREMGYALSGEMPESELQDIARSLYEADRSDGRAWQ